MLADLAESRAGLAEAFARFASYKGDITAEEEDIQEAMRFHALAETHRIAAGKPRSRNSRRKTPEQI